LPHCVFARHAASGAAEPAPAGAALCFDRKVVISRERAGRAGKTVTVVRVLLAARR
jgi:hypothetical protein